jgi:valyl-tRNA synthetase
LAKKYGFPLIKVLDETAHMNDLAGEYKGMDRYECRKALVEKIKAEGHLVKIEKIVHSVGHSERSDAVVEPMLSKQWFVKMKPLAEALLENQKTEDKSEFIPHRFENVLTRWMKESKIGAFPASFGGATGFRLITTKRPAKSWFPRPSPI